ncbi:tRNA(Ile)-lysidine synthase [Gillisia sp. Hel_I_86]|uniref:tRNA lysidine(34) synthetase TilS n=1 Tax=Gillisia sp. Hel_I_86 TaxID=1249981 RepID=UPI0011992FD9|nr:tRNA lysidine(34) synthetase TilS [Gillisia sp. Hel_I_86]TVZ25209.1 tRNA(Ile)-lysidine synthase [Gillisia sp. Hel_I_86]
MEKAFKNHLKSQFPFLCQGKLLLAVSGGVDSVVLAHLCKLAKLNFSIAHCNFDLRAEESDADEEFVLDLAEKLDVEVYIENFDTTTFAENAKISIQMAARELRYHWFEELSVAMKFDYVLTAHHANDNLETFLINLVRGSGLEGFTGIKAVNNSVVRPLLSFSRKEIETYAHDHKITWREDSSNASNKYLRNTIRHEVIPVLEKLNPRLLEGFQNTQSHLTESSNLVEDYMGLIYPEIVSKNKYGYELKVEYLKKLPNQKAVLYQLLKTFGFSEWDDVYQLLDAQTGKMVLSETHRLIKDREVLLLTEIPAEDKLQKYGIREGERIIMLPMGRFTISEVDKIANDTPNSIYVNKELLQYPLILRKWEEGDFFYPFGMKGKKKLSDFFKDKKLSLPEKENCWLLCSNEDIVWVINQRADNRFAITDPSQKIIKITYSL